MKSLSSCNGQICRSVSGPGAKGGLNDQKNPREKSGSPVLFWVLFGASFNALMESLTPLDFLFTLRDVCAANLEVLASGIQKGFKFGGKSPP